MLKIKKSIIIYIIIVSIFIIGFVCFNNYREESLSKTIRSTLQKYFESNNIHIASHNFNIDDVNIRCRGNNSYIVEFDLDFDDITLADFNKIAATVYKDNNVWNVKGFGKGLTTEELKLYRFKCYY